MEITFDGGKVVTAHSHGHIIKTDQPVDAGGTNSAPSPFELFLASIGTCAGIYVKSFCDNRKIPTDGIKIIQSAIYNKETGLPTEINLDFQLPAGRVGQGRFAGGQALRGQLPGELAQPSAATIGSGRGAHPGGALRGGPRHLAGDWSASLQPL